MTHAKVMKAPIPTPGIEPCDCPGTLERLDSFPDTHLDGHGHLVERTIEVYRCRLCDTRVAMSGHLVLNAYRFTRPDEMVKSLAQSFELARKPRRAD